MSIETDIFVDPSFEIPDLGVDDYLLPDETLALDPEELRDVASPAQTEEVAETESESSKSEESKPTSAIEISFVSLMKQHESYDPTHKWVDKSACGDANPEIFFPRSENKGSVSEAKAICYGCVVRENCLIDAFVTLEDNGVKGGMSSRERRAYIKQQSKIIEAKKSETVEVTEVAEQTPASTE